jgi:hypothetical protein
MGSYHVTTHTFPSSDREWGNAGWQNKGAPGSLQDTLVSSMDLRTCIWYCFLTQICSGLSLQNVTAFGKQCELRSCTQIWNLRSLSPWRYAIWSSVNEERKQKLAIWLYHGDTLLNASCCVLVVYMTFCFSCQTQQYTKKLAHISLCITEQCANEMNICFFAIVVNIHESSVIRLPLFWVYDFYICFCHLVSVITDNCS